MEWQKYLSLTGSVQLGKYPLWVNDDELDDQRFKIDEKHPFGPKALVNYLTAGGLGVKIKHYIFVI